MRGLPELRSFAVQLGTVVQGAAEAQNRLDELIANRVIAQNLQNNGKQQVAIDNEIARITTHRDSVLRSLGTIGQRGTFESSLELLTDVRVRLDQASEYYLAWRRAKAVFDLNAALSNFSEPGQPGVTREQAEGQIVNAQKEFEVAQALADELVPAAISTPAIILAS